MIRIRLTMRLYKRHDADLLCLYKQKNHKLQKTIKQAVLAYFNHQDIEIAYPDSVAELADLPSTAQFHLYLSPKNPGDAKILECLSKIPKGFKNSFLKNITRYYIIRPAKFDFTNQKLYIYAERNS